MTRFYGVRPDSTPFSTTQHAGNVDVVAVSQVEAYSAVRAADRNPVSVLWVPLGDEPLPLEDWCDGFEIQLLEERPADHKTLTDLLQGHKVLGWAAVADRLSPGWFLGLSAPPGFVEAKRLRDDSRSALSQGNTPSFCLTTDELNTLEEDSYSCEAFEEALATKDFLIRIAACPSPDALGAWLKGGQNGANAIAAHLRECVRCKTEVVEQSRLWVEAQVIAETQRDRAILSLVDARTAPRKDAEWHDILGGVWAGLRLAMIALAAGEAIPSARSLPQIERSRQGRAPSEQIELGSQDFRNLFVGTTSPAIHGGGWRLSASIIKTTSKHPPDSYALVLSKDDPEAEGVPFALRVEEVGYLPLYAPNFEKESTKLLTGNQLVLAPEDFESLTRFGGAEVRITLRLTT